jgi:diphthine-ammonia ligase
LTNDQEFAPFKTSRPRAAVSWSGGKDCCLALMRAAESYQIVAMVTMFGEDGTRSRSHGLTPAVIRAQAERLSLPVYLERCSWQTYTDQYSALLAQAKQHDVTHVIFGDILGETHREWNERVCARNELTAVMPLWGGSTLLLAQDFIARGGDARFVTVRPPRLDETWLGQKLDLETLTRLQSAGADPCGELGEYHTVVTNCPAFSSPLTLKSGRQVLSNGCYAIDFTVA